VPGAIDFEDRQRDVKCLAHAIGQLPFLPGAVVGSAKRDEDVIRPKPPDGVGEGAERRLVAGAASDRTIGRQLLDMAHHGLKALVGLVSHAIGVGGEPLQSAR
jgi:hypothetical protein